ncbi:MAG: hypothetical protein ACM3MD_09575 [Betaproteobacteria bacterium]
MASTLKLSYSQIRFISTGNFVGYLIAVLFCGQIARRIGSRRLIVIVKEPGFSEAIAGNFWSWVGLLSLFSGPIFGTLSDRSGGRQAL